MEYTVVMDTKEQNFEYNRDYRTNGNTSITYKNEVGKVLKEDINIYRLLNSILDNNECYNLKI